jgi:hypothetical protein
MTGEQLRTSAREICSICQHPVELAEGRTQCPHCGLPFHADCWEENRGCSAYGCPQVNALSPSAEQSRAAPLRSAEAGDAPTQGRAASPPDPFPWEFLLLGASALGVLVSMFTFGAPSAALVPCMVVAHLMRKGKKSWAVFLLSLLVCLAGAVAGYVASRYVGSGPAQP